MKGKRFSRKMKTKFIIVFILFLVALFGLNVRLSFINMKKGDNYTIQVLAQQQDTDKTLAFKRGDILDRNNVALASSVKVYNLILDPNIILSDKDYLEPTVKALASCFEQLTEEDLIKTIKSKKNKSYVVELKQLTYEETEDFLKLQKNEDKDPDYENIKGVWFEEAYERKYPYSTLASDVIGFSDSADAGAVGLEQYYNDYLVGNNGREYGYMNSDNVLETVIKEPENGYNLTTTIDLNIQTIVEKYIAQYKTDYSPKNIAVIIADPNTGEILAMASDKGYDLNNPRDLSAYYTSEQISAMTDDQVVQNLNAIWKNYCVSDVYEPGSTAKPFTIAEALEENKITEDQTFICDGYEQIGGTRVNCWLTTGHGQINAKEAIMQSCDDALMQITALLGSDVFTKYQSVFGFGSYTGIDLPAEEKGLIYNAQDMKPIDLATNSFGQNFNVTMVQMVAGFSSLINGGYYYQPHLVKQITDTNGKVVKNIDKTLVKKIITANTSDFLRDALAGVVTEGTGKAAAVEGYQVGGKTGTAEKQPRSEHRYLLSFVGFAPVDDPKVVCYTIVDDAQVADNGSSSYASRLFSQIMTEVLPYMNIYPN